MGGGGGQGRGSGTRGRCYLPGIGNPGWEATPDPGKAEARFKAGLKAAHEFRRPCLPFIPQAPSGRGCSM